MSRRISYALTGALLGIGAPAGLLLTQFLRRRGASWRGVRHEITSEGPTYTYVAGSTTMVFALFGAMLGRYADELARLATTDPLTGLLNARAFDQRLRQEVARSRRYGGLLSMLLVDLDSLKRINDQQGHQAGDRALQSVASAIRDELREVDVGARIGGDEFAVLAPRTDDKAVLVLGNRVRSRAAERLVSALGSVFTVSVGAVWMRQPDSRRGTASLIATADAALYAAKREGGNRVHVAQLDTA